MSPSLPQRVAEVAQAAERLQRRYALACWAAGGLIALAILGGVDAAWRGHDFGTRLVLSGLVLTAVTWLGWRFLRPLAARPLAPLEVARRIDRFFPQLGNRLSSAIAFLGEAEHDPLAGSAELRRQVVAQAESLAVDLDFRAVLDDAAARQAKRWLMAAGAIALALIVLSPRSAAVAVARLAAPWAAIDWPRQHRLQWVDPPDRVAAGEDLELALEDLQGKLPDSVELQLFYPATGQTERRQMRPFNARMVYRLENVTQPFRYRATGGDDDSLKWRNVQVVEPPQLADLTVEVTPPPHTGWPMQRGGRLVRMLAGSQVRIVGEVDRPLKAVSLAADNTSGGKHVGSVGSEGRSFEIPSAGEPPLIVRESGQWHLEVKDNEGLVSLGSEGVEFRVVPDHPPQLTWKTPADNSYLTPQAKVRISGTASDDLGLAKIELHVLRGEGSDAGGTTLTLYDNAKRQDLTPALERVADGVRRPLDSRWILREGTPVQPGEVLTVSLSANDFSPQTTTVPARRLLIISVEEFQQRAQQRQGAILGQLADVLRLARDARTQSRGLALQLEETKALAVGDLTRLQNAELNQRQVEQQLADPSSGVVAQVGQLLDDLADNQLDGQALGKQLGELHSATERIARDNLPQVAQSLGATLKELRSRIDTGSAIVRNADVAVPLATVKVAGKYQDEAIEALEAILARLSQWDTLARLSREVTRIRQEEQALRDQTEQLRLRLAAADAADAPQRAAESKQLSQQQFDLTRQLDRTLNRMEELRKKLAEHEDGENSGALLLADALDAARRTAASGLMQEAGQHLAGVKPQPAAQTQVKALAALAAVIDALSGRPEKELKRRLEELEATASQIDSLLNRQEQERLAADQAAGQSNPTQRQRQLQRLSRAEERLAQEVAELKRKLERLRSPQAADAANKASEQIAAAAAVASRGDAEATKESTREAKRLLEETKKQLQAAVRQAQADLVQEEMARLEQLLAGLAARQQAALEESTRLEKLRADGGGTWQRAQLASVKAAAADQRGLAEETRRLGEGLQSPSFALALRGAAQEMQRAADGLDRSEAGEPTQHAQQAALNRLNQLRQVLDEQDEPQPPGNEGPGNDQPPNVQSVNELKLLLLLQQEINRRTTELDGLRKKAAAWTPELEQQLAELTAEQGRVADIVFNLLTRSAAAAEEESLPKGSPAKENEE